MSIIDIITLVIATLGFILSVCQWIYVLYSKRTNFSLSIERFEWYRHPEYNRAIFTLMIWNNSSSPLTITRMCINEVKCLISRQWIGERYYPNNPETDIPCTERKLSPDFPICISPHGGGLFLSSLILKVHPKCQNVLFLLMFKHQTVKRDFMFVVPESTITNFIYEYR